MFACKRTRVCIPLQHPEGVLDMPRRPSTHVYISAYIQPFSCDSRLRAVDTMYMRLIHTYARLSYSKIRPPVFATSICKQPCAGCGRRTADVRWCDIAEFMLQYVIIPFTISNVSERVSWDTHKLTCTNSRFAAKRFIHSKSFLLHLHLCFSSHLPSLLFRTCACTCDVACSRTHLPPRS